MPYIHIRTAQPLTQKQIFALKTDLGQAVTLIPGKDEKVLCEKASSDLCEKFMNFQFLLCQCFGITECFIFPHVHSSLQPPQNGCTFAERLKLVQNFPFENLHPVSQLSSFAKQRKPLHIECSGFLVFSSRLRFNIHDSHTLGFRFVI